VAVDVYGGNESVLVFCGTCDRDCNSCPELAPRNTSIPDVPSLLGGGLDTAMGQSEGARANINSIGEGSASNSTNGTNHTSLLPPIPVHPINDFAAAYARAAAPGGLACPFGRCCDASLPHPLPS